MTRDLTNDYKLEIVKSVIRPAIFIEAEFATGLIHLWSGIGSITWNGHNFLGVGKFGKISEIEESGQLKATNMTLALAGVPSDLLGIVLTEVRQGLPCSVWVALLDATGAIIDAPYKAMSGRIDSCGIDEGVETSVVKLTVENQLENLHIPKDYRYTDQCQQQLVAGDLGFQYVAPIQSWSDRWGP